VEEEAVEEEDEEVYSSLSLAFIGLKFRVGCSLLWDRLEDTEGPKSRTRGSAVERKSSDKEKEDEEKEDEEKEKEKRGK